MSNFDRLKVAVNQFYLNKYMDQPLMSDEEYDSLRSEYEVDGKSVMDLVEWEDDLALPNTYEESLDKTVIKDNNLWSALESSNLLPKMDEIEVTPKYDGCAIRAVYVNGNLQSIQSTPDEDFGIVRTRTLSCLFPKSIGWGGTVILRGEALVDYNKYGGTSRNKANGLVNSKNKLEEIKSELFIRIYDAWVEDSEDYPYQNRCLILNDLPTLSDETGRVYFSEGQVIKSESEYSHGVISDPFCPLGTKFQMDGLVVYSIGDDGVSKVKTGFKYYFIDSAETTVTDIKWNEKSNGSFTSVIEFDEVELDGKCIARASAGSVKNLMNMKMGLGAKVKVILSGTTIPKIIEVIEPSTKFNWPICKCGYHMTDNDVYGSVLKCGNSDLCTSRLSKFNSEGAQWILDWMEGNVDLNCKTLSDIIQRDALFAFWFFRIDRWDPYEAIKTLSEPCYYFLANLKDTNINKNEWMRFIEDNFTLSDLQWELLNTNLITAVTSLQELLNKTEDELKSYL